MNVVLMERNITNQVSTVSVLLGEVGYLEHLVLLLVLLFQKEKQEKICLRLFMMVECQKNLYFPVMLMELCTMIIKMMQQNECIIQMTI